MAVEARLMASSPRAALSAGAILKVTVRASGAEPYQPFQHGVFSRSEACSSVRRATLDEQWTVQTPGASDSPARSSLHMHWFGRSTDAGVATDCMHMLRAAAARAALRGVQRACLSCSRAFATGEQAYVSMPCCDCLCR